MIPSSLFILLFTFLYCSLNVQQVLSFTSSSLVSSLASSSSSSVINTHQGHKGEVISQSVPSVVGGMKPSGFISTLTSTSSNFKSKSLIGNWNIKNKNFFQKENKKTLLTLYANLQNNNSEKQQQQHMETSSSSTSKSKQQHKQLNQQAPATSPVPNPFLNALGDLSDSLTKSLSDYIPEGCDSHMDCDAGTICCDFVAFKVCCSDGHVEDNYYQPRMIPVRVRADNGENDLPTFDKEN